MAGERVLVTGSAGHLGEALVRVLRAAGRDVVGIDVLASPFTTVAGTITDRDVVRGCLDGVGAVLHTATLRKPHIGSHGRQEFVDANVTGTLVLLGRRSPARLGPGAGHRVGQVHRHRHHPVHPRRPAGAAP